MSIRKVLAVRDRAVESFGQPFFCAAIGEGVRSFVDEVNREGSPLQAHPDDYDLFLIADYDESNGSLVAVDFRQVASGRDVRKE